MLQISLKHFYFYINKKDHLLNGLFYSYFEKNYALNKAYLL